MGRKSPFRYQFLRRRPIREVDDEVKGGGFLYCRTIPKDVRAAMSGQVHLPWSDQTIVIGSSATIKISLSTTCLATAKTRWHQLHAHVETIVCEAVKRTRRERDRTSASSRVRAPGLSRDQIKTLGAQVEHKILADHEHGMFDRAARLRAREVDWIHRGLDDPPSDRELHNLECRHHWNEAEYARALYREHDFETPNQPLVFSVERGLVDDSAELRADEKAFEIPDEITSLLAENGIELPAEHPDRRLVAREFYAAMQRGHEAVLRRLDGDATIETPPEPEKLVVATPSDDAPRLSQAFSTWKTERRPAKGVAQDYETQITRFIELHGDLPVSEIRRKHVAEFRDIMLLFPRMVPKTKRGLDTRSLCAWADENNVPRLSLATVNDKCVGALSAVFGLLINQSVVEDNPCAGMKLKEKDKDRQPREPYDRSDIARLLRSPLFTSPPKIPRGGQGAAAQWLPLLGLYTGARLEELGQLRTADVQIFEGIHFLDMITLDDAAGGHVQRKNGASRRDIPIHRDLIEFGFLEFVEAQRQAKRTRLFPELAFCPKKEKYTSAWSKWWGRWARKHVSPMKSKCYHSFRHLFADQLRATDAADSMIERLMGHSSGKTTRRYGRGHDLAKYDAVVQRIVVKGVDMEVLAPAIRQALADAGNAGSIVAAKPPHHDVQAAAIAA